jgi:hypothetical protein
LIFLILRINQAIDQSQAETQSKTTPSPTSASHQTSNDRNVRDNFHLTFDWISSLLCIDQVIDQVSLTNACRFHSPTSPIDRSLRRDFRHQRGQSMRGAFKHMCPQNQAVSPLYVFDSSFLHVSQCLCLVSLPLCALTFWCDSPLGSCGHSLFGKG